MAYLIKPKIKHGIPKIKHGIPKIKHGIPWYT